MLAPIRPLRIRAHTVLCLQGFRGEGYSPAFVANLDSIHQELQRDPSRLVEVIEEPDEVCAACPHLSPHGCSLRGGDFEPQMREQDRRVLDRLGLTAGERLPWAQIVERIGRRVTGEDLPAICGQCRWLPLGYCAEGLARLTGVPTR